MPLPIILLLGAGGGYGLYKGVKDGVSVVVPSLALVTAIYLYKKG